MHKKRRCLPAIIVSGIVLVIVGLMGTYQWVNRTRPSGRPVVKRTIPKIKIILAKENIGCRHMEKTTVHIPENRLKNIGRLYQGWKIGGSEKESLTFTKIEDGLCHACRNQQFIGVYQGKVAVFNGRPDRRGPVKEVTSLWVKSLPDREKEDLHKGIPFQDIREKLQLLEGLTSIEDG